MIITQSIIKKLFNHDERLYPCPHWFLRQVLNKDFPDLPKQLKTYERGNYMESLMLGANRDGSKTTDMERCQLTKKEVQENLIREAEGKPLIRGRKHIEQTRIEELALRFPGLCARDNINVIKEVNTQAHIKKKLSDNLFIEGTLDIFPTTIVLETGLKLAIIDLKYTSNLTATGGPFQWGDKSRIDFTQARMYSYLVRHIDFNLNPDLRFLVNDSTTKMLDARDFVFVYWVFDEQGRDRHIPFFPTVADDKELLEKIRKTENAIKEMADEGWKCTPSADNCDKCPVSLLNGGDCHKYSKVL
jgi:hypothetical protein